MIAPVLSFGEALWDLFPDGAVLGGAPLNLTYRLGALGCPSAIVSSLGNDELGDKAWSQIEQYGLNTGFLYRHTELPTGSVRVELDPTGEPLYTIAGDVAYDDIPINDGLLNSVRTARCFCFGTLAQRDERSRSTLSRLLDTRKEGLNLLDLNLRRDCYTRETVDRSLRYATILKINEKEAVVLKSWYGFSDMDFRDLGTTICRWFNLRLCILTLGPKGACISSPEGRICALPSFDVPRVDPCGAGDAFTAGFLTSYLAGRDIPACCRRGNALGSAVTARRGALQKIPDGEAEALERSGSTYQLKESDFAVVTDQG